MRHRHLNRASCPFRARALSGCFAAAATTGDFAHDWIFKDV
nr:hypothetical protein [Marinicella sp. W31]MDC2878986.1 hypothetical protein [Marinicella sp. W31]